MNFWNRHIGDIIRDTVGLTMLEDGAYTRLLDQYYQTERPLPLDKKMLYRLARANTSAERKACDFVIETFFRKAEDGYHQKRCDEEIAKFQHGNQGKDEKRENERERQRRHREHRKQLFDMLREHGEVPSYDTQTGELVALLSRITERDKPRDVTPPVTRDATANQTPNTKHQTPEANKGVSPQAPRGVSLPPVELPAWLPPEAWASWCEFRKRKSGKAWTPKAQELSLRNLAALREQGNSPVAVIEQSIERGWSGLFDVKSSQVGISAAPRQAEGERRIAEFLADTCTPYPDDGMTIDMEAVQ